MAVYQITYKSGAQQFMEMDIEDACDLGARVQGFALNGCDSVGEYSTGATIVASAVAGMQHYITPGYAEQRTNENGGTADFNDAMDAAIQAMMDTAEIEDTRRGDLPDRYVAAVDKAAVMAAFLTALGRKS